MDQSSLQYEFEKNNQKKGEPNYERVFWLILLAIALIIALIAWL